MASHRERHIATMYSLGRTATLDFRFRRMDLTELVWALAAVVWALVTLLELELVTLLELVLVTLLELELANLLELELVTLLELELATL